MGKKSALSQREQVEVVLKLLRKEESAAALARRYRISEPTLYRWRDLFLEGGKQAISGKNKPDEEFRQIQSLKKEIEKREQVIGEFTIANRILKKKVEGSL